MTGRLRQPRAGGETITDLHAAVDALKLISTDPAEAELCARLIARHAKSPDDGDLLADVLGLDVPRSMWRCPDCTHPLGSISHNVTCEPDLTAARIHLLAQAAGRPA